MFIAPFSIAHELSAFQESSHRILKDFIIFCFVEPLWVCKYMYVCVCVVFMYVYV